MTEQNKYITRSEFKEKHFHQVGGRGRLLNDPEDEVEFKADLDNLIEGELSNMNYVFDGQVWIAKEKYERLRSRYDKSQTERFDIQTEILKLKDRNTTLEKYQKATGNIEENLAKCVERAENSEAELLKLKDDNSQPKRSEMSIDKFIKKYGWDHDAQMEADINSLLDVEFDRIKDEYKLKMIADKESYDELKETLEYADTAIESNNIRMLANDAELERIRLEMIMLNRIKLKDDALILAYKKSIKECLATHPKSEIKDERDSLIKAVIEINKILDRAGLKI